MPAQRLYLRGDTWWCSFYANGQRRRVSTGCKDKKAAELRARELERRAADPTHAAAQETTLAQALNAVIPDRLAKKRSDATIHMYSVKAGHLLRLWGDDLPLARIDATMVDKFIEQRTNEGVKPATITKEIGALRAALKIAIRRGWWNGRLEAVMPIGYGSEYKPRRRALTRDEYDRMIVYLEPHRVGHVSFIIGTSARWMESVRARPEDVSDADATVRLRGSKTEGADRTVPLVGFMKEMVERAKPFLPFEPWVSVAGQLKTACKRAGIPDVTPNDLRRTCATWLRSAGVEPSLIAAVLGHTTSAMVERVYGRIPLDALRDRLADRLECDTGVPAAMGKGGRRGVRGERPPLKLA